MAHTKVYQIHYPFHRKKRKTGCLMASSAPCWTSCQCIRHVSLCS
jgi:hypothetical protein